MNDIDAMALRLRTITRLLIRRAYQNSGDGPSRSEQGVLAWLEDKGELTPGDLASREKVRPQTMGQTLDSLSSRGWIKRRPHPTDRRYLLIELSAPGRKALLKSREMRQVWLVRQLEELSSRDRETLAAALVVLERIAQS